MIDANEYNDWKNGFFEEYESFVRKWLISFGANRYLAENMPFFRDGVVDPETWFSSYFRPLFILKEVNTGLKTNIESKIEEDVNQYNKKWGVEDSKVFQFVENEFDDIRIGKFSTWKKVVRLSIMLETGNDTYKDIGLNSELGKRFEKSEPQGYNEGVFRFTTGNDNYINAVKKIAVIDIKKIGAGANAESFLSLQGKHYMEHLNKTKEFLKKQISQIEPTIIVCCCGADNDSIYKCLSEIDSAIEKKPQWYKSNHPGGYLNGVKTEIQFCEQVLPM